MITYDDFKTKLLADLEGAMPHDMELRVSEILKNNDVALDSVSAFWRSESKEKGRVTPVVYLQPYYQRYINDGQPMEVIVDSILKLITMAEELPVFDATAIRSFEDVKPYINFSVINREMNSKRLERLVYRGWHDLAVIYRYTVQTMTEEEGTITITKQLMNSWTNITEEDLYQAAMENAKKQEWNMKPISQVLEEIMGTDLGAPVPELNLYVLTNASKIHGSSILLIPEMFAELMTEYHVCSKGLFILPSSIHEVLAIAAQDEDNVEELKNMVKAVNDSELQKEDVLSYAVYFYDPNSNRISIL